MASALPASSVSSRCFTRPAACLATAPSTRRSRAASFRPAISIQNSSSPTSTAVSAESTSTHGLSPTHRDDLAVGSSWVCPQHAHGALRIRLTDPLQQRVQVGAAQDRTGEQCEQFGLLRRVPGFARPLRRAVDQRGDGDGDRQQHHAGDGVVGFGDRERVAGFDQEVVRATAGQHGRQRGRGDAAEQRDDEHADEEQCALAADVEIRIQHTDEERADRRRDHGSGQPRDQCCAARRGPRP